MKTIYFIRHAKAKKEATSDFLRPLSKKGKSDAVALGAILKEFGANISTIYTSSAIRALSTAKILESELEFSGELIESEALYMINYENLLRFIKSIDKECDGIAIVGHNPAMLEICEHLSDSAIGSMPTCAVFAIEFDVESFSDIELGSGNVILYSYPTNE